MIITLITYRTQGKTPAASRYTWDLTNLRDPIGQLDLKHSCVDGRDDRVMAWMIQDPKVRAVVDTAALMAATHMKPPANDSAVSFAFHDPHGKWIGPAVAELLAKRLKALSMEPVRVIHEALEVIQ